MVEKNGDNNPNTQYNDNKISAYKIMSIIALVCSIISIFTGGFFITLITSIVLSIIIFVSHSPMEKEAKTFAKISLIICIISILIGFAYGAYVYFVMKDAFSTPVEVPSW